MSWLRSLLADRQTLVLDYPVQPRPRYGYGAPAHPALHARIAAGAPVYGGQLGQIASLAPFLQAIPLRSDAPRQPRWHNDFLPPLDAVSLYGLLATWRPASYVEIGSGESTRFARRAIRDHGLETRLVSIDPQPRAEIDALCDEVVRKPLEDLDPAWFSRLAPGDVVFLDGSHRVFQNSDVVAAFLDILPGLPPGVAFGIHDIYLPWDYPPGWSERFYSEQYLLAAYLLGGSAGVEILLPNHFITHTPELIGLLSPVWQGELSGLVVHGEAFWLRTIQ